MMLGLVAATALFLGSIQNQPAPMPANAAQLDAMLAAGDLSGVSKALSAPKDLDALYRNMNWERDWTIRGAPLAITFLYIRDLRAMASQMSEQGRTQMLESASMMALIAYAVITVDGAYCADASAPAHQMDQLGQIAGDTLVGADRFPIETRKILFEIVTEMEARTATSRLRDGYNPTVCRGGMAKMTAGLQAGAPREVPTPKGQFGRTFNVEPAPGYKPGLADPAIAAKTVAERRAQIPEVIRKILKL
ncbi:hypothetical protein J2W22_001937 [Sphingomonas kyeonggiensis]|uniref:hypothetical protein n=1 Tax=Sphingomonas kyeonggiensis TaxID=1268553 RepID=UPI00278B4041|nr:hypothetical protein [Sphingomonas kyeonggiensis]MDQ0249873.1 hypothetical protein [Sphingomonas kyeonggiensis]